MLTGSSLTDNYFRILKRDIGQSCSVFSIHLEMSFCFMLVLESFPGRKPRGDKREGTRAQQRWYLKTPRGKMAAEGRKARATHERRDSMERRDKKFIMHGSPTWDTSGSH